MQEPTASQCQRWGWNPGLGGRHPRCSHYSPALAPTKLCAEDEGHGEVEGLSLDGSTHPPQRGL